MVTADSELDFQAELNDRARRLMQYLKESDQALRPLRRDIESEGHLRLYPSSLPEHDAVRVFAGDAWLTVDRVDEPPDPPAAPREFEHSLVGATNDPYREPSLGSMALDELEEVERYRVEQSFNDWMLAQWRPWARVAGPARRARGLYHELFNTRIELEKEQDRLELVLGNGLFTWAADGEAIRHPIAVRVGAIEFDDHTGRLSVIPTRDAELELHYLHGLRAGDVDLRSRLAEDFSAAPVGPLDDDRLDQLYRPFINSFGLDGEILDRSAPPAPTSKPQLSDTWVVGVRRRTARYQRFFEQVIAAIESGTVSPALGALVAEDAHQLPDPWDEEERTRLDQELLFPKPSNEEQRQIARKLALNPGVTVQGPPGTGKTHTIANLICHLVAHGKRVLVTSQKAQALSVLRSQLPDEIQPLCVTNLYGTGKRTELRDSIDAIQQGLGLDEARQSRDLDDARRRLRETRERVAELSSRLRDVHEADARTHPIDGEPRDPRSLGDWLRSNEETLAFIPDQIGEVAPPLSGEEFRQLHQALQRIRAEDRSAAVLTLPVEDRIGEELQVDWDRLIELREILAGVGSELGGLELLEGRSQEEIRGDCDQLAECAATFAKLQEPWHHEFRKDFGAGRSFADTWQARSESLKAEVSDIRLAANDLLGRRVQTPDAMPQPELVDALEQALERRELGRTLGPLQRGLRKIVEQCVVDGNPLNAAEPRVADLKLVLRWLDVTERRARLLRTWNDIAGQIGAPTVPFEAEPVESAVQHELASLAALIDWEMSGRAKALEISSSYGLPVGAVADPESLAHSVETLTRSLLRFEEAELSEGLDTRLGELLAGSREPNASPLWGELARAMESRDAEAWDAARIEADRLRTLATEANVASELLDRLGRAAPQWASELRVHDGGSPWPIGLEAAAWQWRAAETWHQQLLAIDDPALLQGEIEQAQDDEHRAVESVVALSAWLKLIQRVTPAQKSALGEYAVAMRKVGKGTGQYAPVRLREARGALARAQGAVPVWVMPVPTAVDSFDPLIHERFDVVITDESSQSDLSALALAALADKLVVVGDDKQISPVLITKLQPLLDLKAKHLDGHLVNASIFSPGSSLYDVANAVFTGSVMLKEHFRCLPEIIGFSNQECYRGEILPLRENREDAAWRPVRSILLREGFRDGKVNPPEVDRIVDLVKSLVEDPAYAGRSMGVISLIGDEQAKEISERLQSVLGEIEFERRRIRCGDAYHFQGDERDVMILSMVASAQEKGGSFTRNSDIQRINVAASRARDQVWLVRSIEAADLGQQDIRRKLIDYYADPSLGKPDPTPILDRTESPFERVVAERLLAAGYDVEPQYRVGALRIDFVVRTKSRLARLAVECDGERWHGPERWADDMARQRTLERLGWRFHRLRGAAFYRDPDRSMAALFDVLEAMDRNAVEAKRRADRATPKEEPTPEPETPPPAREAAPVVATPVEPERDSKPPVTKRSAQKRTRPTAKAPADRKRPDRKVVTSSGRRKPKKTADTSAERVVPQLWRRLHQGIRGSFGDIAVGGSEEVLVLAGTLIYVECRLAEDTILPRHIVEAHETAKGRRAAIVVRLGVPYDPESLEWAQRRNVALLRLNNVDRPVAVNPPAEALLRELQG